MKLKRLKVINFFSHEDSEINFDNVDPIALVVGSKSNSERASNGAGKSTITIEAILYALYETTRITENKNASLDDMVRWNSNGQMSVILEFELNSNLYRITRSRDMFRSKGTALLEVLSSDKWKALTGDKKTSTNKEIQSLIGIDYKTFCASVCFQQKEVDSFVSATDSQRKEIIKDILQLDKYEEYKNNAKAKAQVAETQIESLKAKIETSKVDYIQIETKQLEIKNFEEKIKILSLEKKSLTNQLEQLYKKQIRFNEQVEKRKSFTEQIKNKEVYISKLIQSTSQAQQKLEDYKKSYEIKSQDFKKAKEQLTLLEERNLSKEDIQRDGKLADATLKESEKATEESGAEYHKLQGEIQNLERDIENIKALKTTRCSTCFSEITIESKESALKFLEAHGNILQARKQDADQKHQSNKAQVEKNRKALEEVKERLQEFGRWTKEKLHLQSTLKLLKESAQEAKMIIDDQQNILRENNSIQTQYEQELQGLKQELESISINTEEFEELNKQAKAKSKSLSDNETLLTEYQVKKGQVVILLDQMKSSVEKVKMFQVERDFYIKEKFHFDSLVKIFGKEIPTLIIENTCAELSEEANKILASILMDSIEFVTQRSNKDGSLKEVFEVEITRPGVEKPILIDSLSNGQRFRVVFAIRIALSRLLARRRNSATMDFLFYDECFSSLDEEGIDDVVEVFKHLKSEFSNQLIITHRTDLKERFGDNILVVKQDKKGVSKLKI
jgi:DNA repair exonuclease SbcCD ATPase subunit